MDWHLVGIVLQTLIFLAGLYGMVLRTDWQGKGLRDDMIEMKEDMKRLADVVTTQAVQTQQIEHLTGQITMLQRNLEDLRRGNGFVRGRSGLDGEYP